MREKRGFLKLENQQIINKFCEASIKLLSLLKENLPPNPQKFHYNFNIRDLSQIIRGIF
jgi:AAA+ lid domain